VNGPKSLLPAFLFLLLISQVAAQISVRPLESVPTSEAVALASERYNDGDGNYEDFAKVFEIFKSASEAGDPVAQYYVGHMYLNAQGTVLNEAEAWRYFEMAAKQGIDRAYGRMSYMLELGVGFERDAERALRYCRIAAQSDVQSMNNLAFYILSGKAKGTEEEAVSLLEQAVAAGNPFALNNLGYFNSFGRLKNSNPDYGIELLHRAAAKGHFGALRNLWNLKLGGSSIVAKGHPRLDNLPDEETIHQPQARKLVLEAVEGYREAGIEAGLRKLDDKLQVWIRAQPLHPFRRQVWWEAQVLSGRDDPEWSYRLFKWLYEKTESDYLRRNPDRFYLDSTMLHNLSKEQVATGRIAGLTETSERIRKGFRINERIELDLQPRNALRHWEPQLPRTQELQTTVRRQPGSQHKEENIGSPLFYGDLHGLIVLPRASLYQGNWRETLGYSQWAHDWIDAVIKDGIDATVSRPNEVWQLQADVAQLEAEVFEWLGFYDKALERFAGVIEADRSGYRFRHLHEARTGHALLSIATHQAPEEDAESLQALRELRANNNFDTKRAPLEVDLAIAGFLRLQGDHSAANQQLNAVVSHATSERLFLVRVNALRQRIIWSLEDGITTGVEEDLILLLNLCRSKGLKVNEPELYHLYARLKASEDNLPAAINLQQKAIGFYQSIDLYTWLPLRYLELASWYFQIGNYALAQYYMDLARTLIDQSGAEYPAWIVAQARQMLEELMIAFGGLPSPERGSGVAAMPAQSTEAATTHASSQIDLQPIHAVSIPLQSKPAYGLFTLTNLGAATQTIWLTAEGRIKRFEATELGDFQIDVDAEAEFEKTVMEVELMGNMKYLIYVQAPAGQQPLDMKIAVEQDGIPVKEALFEFPESDAVNESAVINAAYIEGNPYYMVSVFHLLQRMETQTRHSMDLRIRASVPARIEGYSGDGELLFVDADGDGAFDSPGDILRSDSNGNGFPDVEFASGSDTTSIELMVIPASRPESNTIDLIIETRDGSGWRVDAVDTIRFKD
jgi:TPR repeat protein